jgi:hypothetical protein
MKHGLLGIGAYWCIIEMLHEQDGYIPSDEIERITFELRSNYDLIKSVLDDFQLFHFDGANYYSKSALLRMRQRTEKSNLAKKSVTARWEKQRNNQENANSDTNVLRTHYDGNTIKEKKGNEKKGNESLIIEENSVLQTETGKLQSPISKENDFRPENPTEPCSATTQSEIKPNQAVSVQIPEVNKAIPKHQKQSKPKFTPPTPEEAKEHAQSIGLPERESQKFYDYFASNGWLVGKARTPMQSWQAALRNWKRNWEDNGGPNRAKPPYTHPPPQKPLISTNVNDWLSKKSNQQTTA